MNTYQILPGGSGISGITTGVNVYLPSMAMLLGLSVVLAGVGIVLIYLDTQVQIN